MWVTAAAAKIRAASNPCCSGLMSGNPKLRSRKWIIYHCIKNWPDRLTHAMVH